MEEIFEDEFLYDQCPNCGSEAIGVDNTDDSGFYECFQCDHEWL